MNAVARFSRRAQRGASCLHGLALTLTFALAAAPGCATAAPLSLDGALALAEQRSEAARAARAGAAGAQQAAKAAGQWPDPALRVGIENLPISGPDRFSTAGDTQTMKRIAVSQAWLPEAKRAARRAAAEAALGKATAQMRIAAAETRLQTALAYLEAWYGGQVLSLLTEAEQQTREALLAARARLAAAADGSAQALALTAALGIAEDESAAARQQWAAARLALQRWVGVAADDLAPAGPLPVPVEAAYIAGHPAVLALQNESESARGAAAVAASERDPDWTWEIAYGQRTGYPDMVSFGVSVPLPIARAQRQDRDVAASLALVDKADAERAEATRAATAEYRMLTGDADRLQQRIDRYAGGVLLPARQRTAVALASYASNQAGLGGVFDARRAELEAQRKLLELRRDLARAQAQLAFKPVTAGAQE